MIGNSIAHKMANGSLELWWAKQSPTEASVSYGVPCPFTAQARLAKAVLLKVHTWVPACKQIWVSSTANLLVWHCLSINQ